MFGARVGLRGSKNPRSRGIAKPASSPITTSNGGLSTPPAMSFATHSLVMPVAVSTFTPYFASNGSISAFLATSAKRPPKPVTTRVFV